MSKKRRSRPPRAKLPPPGGHELLLEQTFDHVRESEKLIDQVRASMASNPEIVSKTRRQIDEAKRSLAFLSTAPGVLQKPERREV